MTAAHRRHPTADVRAAAMARFTEVRGSDGHISNAAVALIAGAFDIGPSTARRWLAKGAPKPRGGGFTATLEDYAAVAAHLSIKGAWSARCAEGIGVSYRTFVRALIERGDPVLLGWARDGGNGATHSRLYLPQVVPNRNHTWETDHSELPVWVTLPRSTRRVKPWITVIEDGKTRFFLALVLTAARPNTETVCAAVVEAAVGWHYPHPTDPEAPDVFVGGLPQRLVYDNGAEFLGETSTNGMVILGVVAEPTQTYSGNEKGKVERAIGTIKREVCAELPGYTDGGTDHRNRSRYGSENSPHVLTFDQLADRLGNYRFGYNAERSHSGLGGRTPLQAWTDDSTELRLVDEASVRLALLKEDTPRTVHKSGIRFRNNDYSAAELAKYRGRKVVVRYLPNTTTWIEAFDLDGRHVCRAYAVESMGSDLRERFYAARGRQTAQVRAVQAKAADRRAHLAALAADERLDPAAQPVSGNADMPAEAAGAPGADPVPVDDTFPLPPAPATKPQPLNIDLTSRLRAQMAAGRPGAPSTTPDAEETP